MANFVQIPNGPVVNLENMETVEVQISVLILHMVSGKDIQQAYANSDLAYQALLSINTALLNPTSGTAAIYTISPNTTAVNADTPVVITGTALRTTAVITVTDHGANTADFHAIFVNSATLQANWIGFDLPTGTYDVVYTDSAGGSSTIVNGFTVTP